MSISINLKLTIVQRARSIESNVEGDSISAMVFFSLVVAMSDPWNVAELLCARKMFALMKRSTIHKTSMP